MGYLWAGVKSDNQSWWHNDIVHTFTFTLQSLAEQPIQERPTMVTECEPLIIVHHETMGDVDIEPLSLLDTLVQLLRSNITINVMLHNTTLDLAVRCYFNAPWPFGEFSTIPAGNLVPTGLQFRGM